MASVPRVPVIVRSEWGARTPGRLRSLGDATRITVHHTAQGYSKAARADVSQAEGIRSVKRAEASHRNRGWADIGYHFLIDGAGRVYQGRSYVRGGSFGPSRTPPVLASGAHVGGHNLRNIGVNLMGCFGDSTSPGGATGCTDTPSPAALASLESLLRALMEAYGVRADRIVGHRDLAPTVCPGDALYAELPGIRSRLS